MGFDLSGLIPKRNEPNDGYKDHRWNASSCGLEDTGTFADHLEEIDRNNNPGEYFRNNVWAWRPLWNYVCNECSEILTEEDMENGCYNGGHEISEEKAILISEKLFELIEVKETKKYEISHTSRLKSLPLEDCTLCNGTGIRNDDVVKGSCNSCNTEYTKEQGIPIGKKKSFQCSYPFDTDNVKAFANFCKESGGFVIC